MRRYSALNQARRAVTLTELLVVMVIVSILATIALPVYINHAERARIATAQLEVKELAEAEDAVGLVHGFYVPLQVLDDLPGFPGSSIPVNANTDTIGRETSVFAIDFTQSLTNLGDNQENITISANSQRVRNMVRDWQGPFMSFQRFYIGDAFSPEPNQLDSNLNLLDHPLDPWGSPYRLYSPLGLVGSGASSTNAQAPNSSNFSNGLITSNDDRFDRWAVVSYGPDGESNSNNLTNLDDIMYFFGTIYTNRNETAFAPVPTATPQSTATPTPTPIP